MWRAIGLLVLLSATAGYAAPLDFDELANGSKTQYLGTDALPNVPTSILFGKQPATQLAGGGYLLFWLDCKRSRCAPVLYHYEKTKRGLDETKRIELPLPIRKPLAGLKYRPTAIVNWNGSSQALIRYEVYGPPRPSLGSLLYEMLVIVNLPDLSIAFTHEIERGGEATVDSHCSYEVERTEGGEQKLRLTGTCEGCDLEPKGCKSPRPLPAEAWIWNAEARRYKR